MIFDKNTDIDELLKACKEHNDVAFSELVLRYTPLIRKMISDFGEDFLDESELFSEACVALHHAVISYDASQKDVTFGLYARVCIYHRFVDIKRRHKELPECLDCNLDSVESGDSPDLKLVERERLESIILYAKSRLSDYEYTVLLLHIQGYKTAAIAKSLNKPPKSVDNAKARLFRRLREASDSIS